MFVAGDSLAAGAIRAFHEVGLQVPEDVSVVGCDDVDWAMYFNPPLTTVAVPMREIGEQAAELFLHIVQEGSALSGHDGHRIVLKTRLMVRGSTARVRN